MATKMENFNHGAMKKGLPDIRVGDTVRVHQKIGEGEKAKIQAFEGMVIARKHGNEPGSTITVRRLISGVGVEKIFPVHSPIIEKIDVLKRAKVRRAKLYYLRNVSGKRARLRGKTDFSAVLGEPEKATENAEETAEAEETAAAPEPAETATEQSKQEAEKTEQNTVS